MPTIFFKFVLLFYCGSPFTVGIACIWAGKGIAIVSNSSVGRGLSRKEEGSAVSPICFQSAVTMSSRQDAPTSSYGPTDTSP